LRIDPEAPISELHLCAVCILYARDHRITGLPGFISAVSHHALRVGHPPLPRGRTFDRVKAGLDNYYGDTNFSEPTKAITMDDLRAMHAHLDLTTFANARDWCACLLAFFGLLRIKEYTCSGLLVQHVMLEPWGINLVIPFSKTSLIPTAVAIIRRDDELCPVSAYKGYVKHLPDRLRRQDVAFFLHDSHSVTPLSNTTFIRRVRLCIRGTIQRDADDYSGHSFRGGGTSALQLAGVSESTIAAHGRWKSLAYRAYFDVQHNLQLRLLATAQLRLHSRRRPEPSSHV
jgi:hypothetical protein